MKPPDTTIIVEKMDKLRGKIKLSFPNIILKVKIKTSRVKDIGLRILTVSFFVKLS